MTTHIRKAPLSALSGWLGGWVAINILICPAWRNLQSRTLAVLKHDICVFANSAFHKHCRHIRIWLKKRYLLFVKTTRTKPMVVIKRFCSLFRGINTAAVLSVYRFILCSVLIPCNNGDNLFRFWSFA